MSSSDSFLTSPQELALVTGATGFTGFYLVQKLLKKGFKVRALARPNSDRSLFAGLSVEWILGDIFDETAVQKAVRGVSVIFNMATLFRNALAKEEDHWKVHVKGTQLMAREAAKEKGLKRFVHISTVGVHGDVKHPPANEDSPFAPGDAYQRTKAEAEIWIRDFSKKSGLPLTVIRPAAIYGPGDKRLFKIFRMIYRGWFPIIGGGRTLFHLIHVDDLTDFMIFVTTQPQALGEVFICASPESVSLGQMIEIIRKAYGQHVRVIRLPKVLVFSLAVICEFVCQSLGIVPPLFRRRVAFYTHNRSFDISKMKHLTGFIPKYSSEEGLYQTALWYKQNGWLEHKPRAFSFRKQDFVGVGHDT